MKTLLKILLIPALICYFAFSFIQWDYNPANWHIITRYVCFAFYIVLLVAVVESEVK